MLSPIIRRVRKSKNDDSRSNERGVTIALVAMAMVAIISMAALSIDIGTLYQAKAEAQRAADVAALTAARVISISGITGDPTNGATDGSWTAACGGVSSTATLAATAIAQAQANFVGGAAIPAAQVLVTYGAGSAGASNADCTGLGQAFAVNPVVKVKVQQTNLPIFFARVFSLVGGNYFSASVSASATAEVFNPSGSGTLASGMVPVQPRCVKPWIVPNRDPGNTTTPHEFVSLTGTISNPAIYVFNGNNGVIGESFDMNANCSNTSAGTCTLITNPPKYTAGVLHYVPALVSAVSGAVPACAVANNYQEAIAGCDQTTVYACGTVAGAEVDLTENPISTSPTTGDTATAVQCLTNLTAGGGIGGTADTLLAATYPFQIEAGSSNPLVKNGVVSDLDQISASNSIVTLPIFNTQLLSPPQTAVTIIGFLQVFINQIKPDGNLNVTVMNVSGCSNDATAQAVSGTSPVPIRLITPP